MTIECIFFSIYLLMQVALRVFILINKEMVFGQIQYFQMANQMIQSDIDLVDIGNYKDSYCFAIKLLNLKKNKHKHLRTKKNSHFKFIIEQDDYIIDQTKDKVFNLFATLKTSSISLSNQILHFMISDFKQSNAEFQFKMYFITLDEVEEIGFMSINVLVYIQIFLEDSKSVFRQTFSVCPEYSLQYEIYIGKTRIQLQNLLSDNQDGNSKMRNAFKKKANEVIQIQNEKVQIRQRKQNDEMGLLRKSLHFNTKKLIQVKKRKQQLKQRSQSLDNSRRSFFSKLGDIFKSKPDKYNQVNNSFQNNQVSRKRRDSEKSFAVSPPLIGPHKYFRPQNKSFYHSLKLERQKQKERLQKSLNIHKQQSQQIEGSQNVCLKMVKISIVIVLMALMVYMLTSSNKKIKGLVKSNYFNF